SSGADLEPPDAPTEAHGDRVNAGAATATTDLPPGTPRERCTIVGRIVDDLHRPVADAMVTLHALPGPWSTSEDAPDVVVPVSGGTAHTRRFEATTDERGTFHFDVPPPDWRVQLLSRSSLYVEDIYGTLHDVCA